MATTRFPELDLDLTFHPIHCPDPKALTPAQVTAYNDYGCTEPITIFEPEQCREVRDRFVRSDVDNLKRLNPHIRIQWVHELVTDPKILACLHDLLGPNVVCFISQCFDKPPGSGTLVPGHQDAAYFAVDVHATVKAWLAIDDVDAGNGAMQVCPGSHKLGALEVRDPSADLNIADEVREDVVRRFGTVPLKMKAGQIVFFSTLLVHLSPPNLSTERYRRAITMAFARTEIAPQFHPLANHAPLLCSGRNVDGHWPLLPPPAAL